MIKRNWNNRQNQALIAIAKQHIATRELELDRELADVERQNVLCDKTAWPPALIMEIVPLIRRQ